MSVATLHTKLLDLIVFVSNLVLGYSVHDKHAQ